MRNKKNNMLVATSKKCTTIKCVAECLKISKKLFSMTPRIGGT